MTVVYTLGHSPDSDDAFMFYALANRCIDAEGLEFTHILQDIETLNRRAFNAELDVTALSLLGFAHVSDKYDLLASGASVGDGYGPIVVTKSHRVNLKHLEGSVIAVPGLHTTAYGVLRLYLDDFSPLIMPFDRILESVACGEVAAGLIIHEGQLTYGDHALHLAADLGRLWKEDTGLPLPLGVNAIRKDFSDGLKRRMARVLKRSIEYGLAHRQPALDHALQYGRGLERERADRFVGMYVNHFTLELGDTGRTAVGELLQRWHTAGLIPSLIEPIFIGDE